MPRPFGSGPFVLAFARAAGQRSRGAGEPQHRFQVDAGGDQAAHGGDRVERRGAEFRSGDEPEVARRHGEPVAPAQHAEHGDARGVGRRPQQNLVPRRAGLVEDHPADARAGVPGREPVQQGGGRRADAARVDHEHDRRGEQPRDVRRRREARWPGRPVRVGDPVEQAHHALDDRDVRELRGARPPGEQGRDLVLADQPGVEVAAWPARGERVVARVDVVGPDLVRRDLQAALAQRAEQAGRDRRLAVTAARRRDDDARDGHGATPFTIRFRAGPSGRRPSGA